MMVRDYNENLNRLTTLLSLNNPLKPRLLITGIKHNLPNINSFESIIKEVSNLISNVSVINKKFILILQIIFIQIYKYMLCLLIFMHYPYIKLYYLN